MHATMVSWVNSVRSVLLMLYRTRHQNALLTCSMLGPAMPAHAVPAEISLPLCMPTTAQSQALSWALFWCKACSAARYAAH